MQVQPRYRRRVNITGSGIALTNHGEGSTLQKVSEKPDLKEPEVATFCDVEAQTTLGMAGNGDVLDYTPVVLGELISGMLHDEPYARTLFQRGAWISA